jgi:hypothetical protein
MAVPPLDTLQCADAAGPAPDAPQANAKDPVMQEFEARMAQCAQCLTLKLGAVLAVALAAAVAALVKLL